MVFFRAFVMLACLIVVPLAAIFGSAFPEVVKSAVDRCLGSNFSKSDGSGLSSIFGSKPADSSDHAPANATADMAPRWQGAPGAPAPPSAPWNMGGSQSPAVAANPAAGPTAPGGMLNAIDPNTAATATAAVPPNPNGNMASLASAVEPGPGQWPGNPVRQAAATDATAGPAAVRPEQIPNGYGTPNAADYAAPATPGTRPLPPGDTVGATPQAGLQPERFQTLERKLREYGATYYLLETWGNEGDLYRFQCKMAVGSNPNLNQRFEATDHDALRAMQRVLEQVEAWRAGRSQ